MAEAEDDPKNPGFVTLTIQPHADLASLREVFVVFPLGGRLREEDPPGGMR